MRGNLNELIKQQLVLQFENVVKEEIRQHNIAIKRSDQLVNELKEMFYGFYDEHKKLKSINESLYLDTQKHFEESKKDLEKKHSNQDRFLGEKGKELDSFQQKFNEDTSCYIKDDIFNDLRSQMLNEISLLKLTIEKERKLHKNSMYELHSKNRSFLELECNDIKQVVSELRRNVSEFEKRLEENIVDATGISRMIKINHKEMFIMEKKIENLYTLIERINKRVEHCHKQV